MDNNQQAETKKDKRLLVLLAFGALFLLPHISIPLPPGQVKNTSWAWVEGEGRERPLLRIGRSSAGSNLLPAPAGADLPDTAEYLHDGTAIDVQGRGGDRTFSAKVSPRLALLLGRPLPVNRSSADELALLKGIGPKLAASIVSYRNRHGRISNEQALRAVPGIGERLAARISPQLSYE